MANPFEHGIKLPGLIKSEGIPHKSGRIARSAPLRDRAPPSDDENNLSKPLSAVAVTNGANPSNKREDIASLLVSHRENLYKQNPLDALRISNTWSDDLDESLNGSKGQLTRRHLRPLGKLRSETSELLKLPEISGSKPPSLVATNKYYYDQFERKPRKGGAKTTSSSGLSVGTIPFETTELRGVALASSLNKRLEYGRNLERNWLKTVHEEAQRHQHSLVSLPIDCAVKDIDSFYKSFYTSGSDSESEAADAAPPSDNTDNPATATPGGRNQSLLRFASMDVLLSGDEVSDESGISDIESYLKESSLLERKTKYKGRRKYHRNYKKHRCVRRIYDGEEEVRKYRGSHVVGLSDTELRALRLRLLKDEKNQSAKEFDVDMSNDELNKMTRLALAKIYSKSLTKKVLRKRRKKPKKKGEEDVPELPRRQTGTELGEKFRRDNRLLMKELRSEKYLKFSLEPSPLMGVNYGEIYEVTHVKENASSPRVYKSSTKTFLNAFSTDRLLLKALPGFKGRETFIKAAQCIASPVLGIIGNLRTPHIQTVNGEMVIRPHRLATRRKSDPGHPNLHTLRYTRKVKQVSEPRGKSGRKGSKNNDEASEPCETFVEEEVTINTKVLRRTKSLRDLRFNTTEVNLIALTKGVDFPAKEVKLQVAMRRIKRFKKRQELAKQKAALLVFSQADTAKENQTSSSETKPAEPATAEEQAPEQETEESEYTCSVPPPTPVSPVKTPSLPRYSLPKVQWKMYSFSKSLAYGRSRAELDLEIANISDMFLDMKDCRYLRLTQRDQAIIERINELKLMGLL